MTACTDPACARLREEIREALIQAWADHLDINASNARRDA